MSNFVLCNPGLFMRYVDTKFLADNFNDEHIKKILDVCLKTDSCDDAYVKKLIENLDADEKNKYAWERSYQNEALGLLSLNPDRVIKCMSCSLINENRHEENVKNALKSLYFIIWPNFSVSINFSSDIDNNF